MMKLLSNVWEATLKGDNHTADQIICSGANVNEPIGQNPHFDHLTTQLHLVAALGDAQRVRLLLKHGADCHACDSRGRTPLHWAVSTSDKPDIIEELIKGGAVVDAQDDDASTPLHLAATLGFDETVQKLIDRGASLEAVDARGWSSLHLASLYENSKVVELLTSYKIKIDVEDSLGWTPLHFALDDGKIDIIQRLLDKGADVNRKARGGKFPLYFAAKTDCPASLRLLLDRGARINEKSDQGDTALHVACENGIADVADLLLKRGADINARNREGKKAFELLPKKQSSEAIARIFIQEIVKHEAMGEPLCQGYKNMVRSCENYWKFDLECREEVKQMRNKRIDVGDSAVSLFYIFAKNDETVATLTRNKDIVKTIKTSNCLASFSIYANDLIAKFEMAKRRANFLMKVEDFLVNLSDDIFPTLIVQKIATYLEPDDIVGDL